MALYLYASGAQRQTISVMSHLGICESYQNLPHKPRTNTKRRTRRVSGDEAPPAPPPSTPELKTPTEIYSLPDPSLLAKKIEGLRSIKLSTLRELSSSMRSFSRVSKFWEELENGTCATIFALWKARLEDMNIQDLHAAFNAAPPLSLKDILFHCILRIIVEQGGEKFEKFRKDLDATSPVTPDKIELHQTHLHGLPAWKIDQSTIIGNEDVADAIYTELEVKGLFLIFGRATREDLLASLGTRLWLRHAEKLSHPPLFLFLEHTLFICLLNHHTTDTGPTCIPATSVATTTPATTTPVPTPAPTPAPAFTTATYAAPAASDPRPSGPIVFTCHLCIASLP
ncbi:hypothetical protein B0H14DRAFT_3887868 [Mycena olivaceomarginata]|nr:hypothetical protein B0H14DRAFT_3887868 [Mycena olivaceomarginata]